MHRDYQHANDSIHDQSDTSPGPASRVDPDRPARAAASCDMCGANLQVQGHDHGCVHRPEPVPAMDRTGRDTQPADRGTVRPWSWLFGGGRR